MSMMKEAEELYKKPDIYQAKEVTAVRRNTLTR